MILSLPPWKTLDLCVGTRFGPSAANFRSSVDDAGFTEQAHVGLRHASIQGRNIAGSRGVMVCLE